MRRYTIFSALGLVIIGVVVGVIGIVGLERSNEITAEELHYLPLGNESHAPLELASPSTPTSQTFIEVAKISKPAVVGIQVKLNGAHPDALNFFHEFDDQDDRFEEDEEDELQRKRDMFHWFFRSPKEPLMSSGSGVFIRRDGYIMTNHHVVKSATSSSSILVTLSDKREFQATLVGGDPLTDIAVIKIEGKNFATISFGNSDHLQVGEWVMAVGNPFDLTSTVTTGIVSAIDRNINIIHDSFGVETFIQTDAVINPGNSGGALVNLKGELVGINTAIATRTGAYQGYGFAIPANLARSVAQDLIAHGKVIRGYIGISLGEVDATMAKALGLKQPRGALIQDVLSNGAAIDAGLKQMDVILKIDDVEITERNQLQAYVARKRPGDALHLKIWRDKKMIELPVTLKPLRKKSPVAKLDSLPKQENLGIAVANLSQEEKSEFHTAYGIRVTSIDPFGTAFTRGISKNDLILEVNRQKVLSVEAFHQRLALLKSEEAVLMKIRKPYSQSSMFVAVELPH